MKKLLRHGLKVPIAVVLAVVLVSASPANATVAHYCHQMMNYHGYSAWDCVCDLFDGFYFDISLGSLEIGISPLAWDFKLFEVDACPDQAPDCHAELKLGPLYVSWGC